jgi:hypothetical protein
MAIWHVMNHNFLCDENHIVLYYHHKCELLHTLPRQPIKVRFKVQGQNCFWNIKTQTFKPNLMIVMFMRSYWKLVELILVELKHLQPCAKQIELGMKTFLCTKFVISLLNELYEYKNYVWFSFNDLASSNIWNENKKIQRTPCQTFWIISSILFWHIVLWPTLL